MRITVLACLLLVAPFSPTLARQQKLFDFHSAFWMNLHHYLHALARPSTPLADTVASSATAEERQQWAAAVEHYRAQYGKRSLLFDDEMVRIRQQLGTAGSSDSLRQVTLAPEHRQLLEAAAPIYRRHWWVDHHAANQRFIAALQELLQRHGQAIARRLTASFDTTWPETPLRVDVVHDAGPPGNAYTISEPTLITIGVGDPRQSGLTALELVFHEASHRWDAVLMRDVSATAGRLKLRAPAGLWHGLLFYNAGAITTDALSKAGSRDYQMYMFAQKTFDFPGWHQAIARHWRAFLSGRISRADAIARILRELTPPPAAARAEPSTPPVSNLQWRLHP